MDDVTGFFEDELTAEVSKDGIKLIVLARRIERDQWQLSVLNEYGISSNWLEFFATAQLALDVGKEAIEKDGTEPFIDTEGFAYLFDENV